MSARVGLGTARKFAPSHAHAWSTLPRVKLRILRALSVSAVLGACVVLGDARVARAADSEAEAWISQGIALREQGKDDQALELFRKADAKAKTPRSTAQVALAEQALGMWVLAETHLTEALAAKDDPWITKNRAALEGALGTIQKHVGSLEVRLNVAKADVYVDGALVGGVPRPTPLRVEVGPHQVELRASGYYPVSHQVTISVDSMARETYALSALPATPPPGTGSNPGGAGPGSGGTIKVVSEPANVPRTVGWVLVGTAAAGAVFGGIAALIRETQTGRYNDRVDIKSCPGPNNSVQPPACQDILDTRSTWGSVATGSFIGAGVLAVAGLAVVVLAPSTKPTTVSATGFGCGPGPLGGLGVSCAGTF